MTIVASIICLAMSVRTIQRNHLFTSRRLFWEDVVQTSPLNTRARLNYASALASDGDWTLAMRETQAAVDQFQQPSLQQLDPVHAYRCLGDRWLEVGDTSLAMRSYLTAYRLQPTNTTVRHRIQKLLQRIDSG
ncbi:MAG: hypothetical protein AAFP69_14360, partial [Planctomycetota bacterium]